MSKRGLAKDKTLTPRQAAFVTAYLVTLSAERAARLAGYSCKTDACMQVYSSKLLHMPHVRKAIDARMRTSRLSDAEIIARIEMLATTDLTDFIRRDEEGKFYLDLKALRAAGKGPIVAGVQHGKYGSRILTKDGLKALELLARARGLLVDRHEVGGPGGGPVQVEVRGAMAHILTDPETFAAAAALSARVLPAVEAAEASPPALPPASPPPPPREAAP